jgi:hypothetical protein
MVCTPSNLFLDFNMCSSTKYFIKLNISRISWLRGFSNYSERLNVYIRKWDCLSREHVHRPYQDLFLLASTLLVPKI